MTGIILASTDEVINNLPGIFSRVAVAFAFVFMFMFMFIRPAGVPLA
jgi:hypothetical protein